MRGRRMTVRKKLLLHYILAMLAPVILTNGLLYSVMSNRVIENKKRDIAVSLEQITINIKKTLDGAVSVSNLILSDRQIQETLDARYTTPLDFIESYKRSIESKFGQCFLNYPFLQDMHFYTNNSTALNGAYLNVMDDSIRKAAWYRSLRTPSAAATHSPVILYMNQSSTPDEPEMICILRYFPLHRHDIPGSDILRIDIKPGEFRQFVQDEQLKGRIELRSRLNPSQSLLLQDDSRSGQTSGKKDRLVVEQFFSTSGNLKDWVLRGEFSRREQTRGLDKSRELVAVMAVVNLIVPGAITLLIARSLYGRVVALARHIRTSKSPNGELAPVEFDPGGDEIGLLIMEYNRMTRRLNSLIEDVYKAEARQNRLEIERKRTELQVLQNQMNPHFLFNALETIRMRSHLKGETETADIIKRLAGGLRRSLLWGNDFVELGDELSFVRDYLSIQKYRYDDKINYTMELNEGLERLSIPKFCIFNFVENCCIHGIPRTRGPGWIRIQALPCKRGLRIIVEDNGCGVTADKLQSIRTGFLTREPAEGHIGMKNVYDRLCLLFREEFALEIESEEGKGMRVMLEIPVKGATTS